MLKHTLELFGPPKFILGIVGTGLFLYLRPYHNPWIKKAKKLLGCAQDFRLENWILVEWIDKTQTLPKLSLENLGRVCVLPIHSTTFQFSNLKSWAHPYNFFAFLIHGLWFGRSYKNRPVGRAKSARKLQKPNLRCPVILILKSTE